jgi:pimeloyl-ACP methyl ester carboxylesterase
VSLLDVNGIRLNVVDTGPPAGRPDAPVVVLGHGLLFSTTMWRHQVEALRPTYRCVALDWRGQGGTPATADGYDMDTLYADAVALIEHLDVGPVHYAGLSMGGFVGLRLAARRPDLVRSLTLIDTSAGPEDPANVGRYKLLASLYRLLGWRPLRSRVAPIMFSAEFLATSQGREVVETWSAELGQQGRRGTQQAILGVVNRLAVDDEVPAIKVPTMLISGSEDVATPTDRADAIADVLPDVESVTLAGVGHVSALEAPDAVTEALLPFLAAH